MMAEFDKAAIEYDEIFTHSQIGSMQRNQVWKHLTSVVLPERKLDILEINCGTGEDAIKLAAMGHHVIATDASNRMLDVASSKPGAKYIHLKQLDMKSLGQFDQFGQYDLIFSNFGGINCIDDLSISKLSMDINSLLKPGGRFIAVVMPDFCLWESFYYLMKNDFERGKRRLAGSAVANVSGIPVNTWYYAPKNLYKKFKAHFKVEKIRPIGLFIPPSYLEHFFRKNVGLLKVLKTLEVVISGFSWVSGLSDHYYIQLIKR